MLNAVKQSEENYVKEQEQVRVRDKQLRSARQINRSDFNYLTLANSTPIRNDNTRSDQPGVHFNTNPICHVYSATTDEDDQYEPPINDSIIQGAGSSPTDQFTTNAIGITGCNDRGDEIMAQIRLQTQPHTEGQPDQPVAMVYATTTCQTLQTLEMAHMLQMQRTRSHEIGMQRESFLQQLQDL